MQAEIIRITVSRKTGKELSRRVIGETTMSEEAYQDGCVALLTGMSPQEATEHFLARLEKERQNAEAR